MENWLNIGQVAEILEVSKDTVRRRIKSGEIEAEKRLGKNGEQWMIDGDKLQKAMQEIEVVPVSRAVSVAELEQAMRKAIAAAVSEAVNAEVAPLHEQMEKMAETIARQEEMLKAALESKQPTEQPKSLFRKIFG